MRICNTVILITGLLYSTFAADFAGRTVLNEVPLIDGHNDFPAKIYSYARNNLDNFDFNSNLENVWNLSQTDLPRLRQGKVGGQFWAAFVSCSTNYKDAVERTLDQIDVIKRLVNAYPRDLSFVTSSAGIVNAFIKRKIASLIGVEGGHSIDSRLSVLRLYYELGVRYLTLTHNCNTPWSDNNLIDANNNTAKSNLTQFGLTVITEMNRLGMMIDLSHVSKGVMEAALNHSKAPVIFSHSSAYSVWKHTRNVQDDILLKLKLNGGIIMVNFYSGFIAGRNASIYEVIDHLNHIKKLIGSEHVGIGADYDGVSPPFTIGLEDVSTYPVLFDKLSGEFGWTRRELRQLAGLNLIRVLRGVEKVRDQMKRQSIKPNQTLITVDDMIAANATLSCRTDLGGIQDEQWN